MQNQRWRSLGFFLLSFVALWVMHFTLLRLPYFWDEAGYYIPAARDILIHGSLIPVTTVSNAHPPLVMLWLATAWKMFGYSTLVARTAMLAVAAFALTGLYRLARKASNATVALGTVVLTALYPVFFAQSSLGHVDLAAAGITFWGLAAYFEDRPGAVAFWFCLAVLAKETALLTPAVLAVWEVVGFMVRRWPLRGAEVLPWRRNAGAGLWLARANDESVHRQVLRIAALTAPLLPLSLWYLYHFSKTGYVFGNPEFVRYNVTATLSLTRTVLAMLMRLWQVFGYLHLWVLTGFMIALCLLPLGKQGRMRPRIQVPFQMVLLLIVTAYVIAMSVIGGAVLARYMLTAIPLVILAAVSTIWRRSAAWIPILLFCAAAFVAAWWWNPPYGFSPEDNLTYRDFIVLHQNAAAYMEAHTHGRRVLTAWPATDELKRPWLGYVSEPISVEKIENFSDVQLAAAGQMRDSFDFLFMFSTKYEADRPPLFPAWEATKSRLFDYHRDLLPDEAAEQLSGRILLQQRQHGLWTAVIAMDQMEWAQGDRSATRHSDAQDVAGVRLDHQPDVLSGREP